MSKVSIILVHYKEAKVLYDCIRSIYQSGPKTSFEIIVVDNDEVKKIGSFLAKKFPKIKYIKPTGNLGYGKGNNLGVKNAKGKYVFILNPDTLVAKGAIDNLVSFLEKGKRIGIVAPTLFDKNGKAYPLQGTKTLTPLRGVFALSFLNKLLPKNHISTDYWLKNVDRSKPWQVDVVPGSAFLIKRGLFARIGGFDKSFFLYFEEFDLCKRVKELGYKLFMLPQAKLTHFWAVSTPPSEAINKVFKKSRFYYFRKHFGLPSALAVELFARANKVNVFLFLLLITATFLRFYRIEENLVFHGEIGTDYLNVLKMLSGERSFLLGPRTSHEWFYIPPLAYWLYIAILKIGSFNPLVVAYFWGLVSVLGVYLCYKYIEFLFGKTSGLISATLMTFSGTWITLARDARYNAMVAFLFLPYLFILRNSIEDKGKSLFALGLILGLMMSFFPSPILLIPAVFVSFLYFNINPGFKNILKGIFGFIIPTIPLLAYDLGNRLEIIKSVALWVPYRVFGFFGILDKNTVTADILRANLTSFMVFFSNVGPLLLFSVLLAKSKNLKLLAKSRPFKLVIINLVVAYLGLFIHGNPPIHYYYTILPVPIIIVSVLLPNIRVRKLSIILVLFFVAFNLYRLVSTGWFYTDHRVKNYTDSPVPYRIQLEVIEKIIKDAQGRPFSLARVGANDRFENNFANNYLYLLKLKAANVILLAELNYTIYEEFPLPKIVKTYESKNFEIK